MANILATGANGLIGKALLKTLVDKKFEVTASVRKKNIFLNGTINQHLLPNLDHKTNWGEIIREVKTIIHTIGRAHITKESAVNPLAEFRKVNTDITKNLASQAAKAGVQRFIYLSSIGVNGESSAQPFTETNTPSPQKDYAISKHEAELALMEIADKTDMEVTIIRPPLVYGPNAPGNFGKLVNWIKQGKLLPLGAIHNRRSFIALDNLVDFIIHCIDHPQAGNKTFVISDGEDASTTQFIRYIGDGLGKTPHLLPVPTPLLRAGLTIFGKKDTATSLLDNLQIDNTKARTLLDWEPPVTMAQQMQKLRHS